MLGSFFIFFLHKYIYTIQIRNNVYNMFINEFIYKIAQFRIIITNHNHNVD